LTANCQSLVTDHLPFFHPMPSKNRLFLLSGLVVLVVVLAIAFAPFAVSNGIRLWISWAAKQEGFIATIDQIDSSFLRPVVIRQLHLKSMRENALRVDLTATDASVGLNFKHILLHMGGRIIHSLSIRELRVEVHRTNPNMRAITRRGWATLQRLLPEDLSIANSEIRVENGPTLILLRRGILSASETEAGRFSAAEIMIASPWLRQTFSQLRGATHWEDNRLTLGGLTLSRGLDLQSATADCRSRPRISRVWANNVWECSSTLTFLEEKFAGTFHMNGALSIPTGKLQAARVTFPWDKPLTHSGSPTGLMVCFMLPTSLFAETSLSRTI
jgi:hypothetical protein